MINGPLNTEAVIISGLSDGSVIAAGMDKSDGSADVYTDLCMPNRAAIWDEFIDGAKTVGQNAPYAGTQRLYVQAFMADP
ncbi:MAG: hypothetical protein ABJH07_05225 [Sedimentitalea sp.]|uniref:hypothetical protein n=1 Tax=Sedimentitalea sp. TaxID=2048915 RepID=UPI003263DF39